MRISLSDKQGSVAREVSLLAYDTKQGLFKGSLGKNQWIPASGALSKYIPLARDPKTGELLVTPAGPMIPWDESKPIGQLSLHLADKTGTSVRPDRLLDLTGMGVQFFELSFSAKSVLVRHREIQDRVMLVEGVLPGFRK